MKAVILAAGKGTKMLPLTVNRPKMMIPILNRPILEHTLVGLREAGVKESLLVVGHQADKIRAYFGDGSAWGVRVEYAEQDTGPGARYGTAVAVELAEPFVNDEPFVLTFGDIMTPLENYSCLMEAFHEAPDALHLSVNPTRDPSTGGAVYVKDGRVTRIIEKPSPGTARTHYINAGIFVLNPSIFPVLHRLRPSKRGEYELTSAVSTLIKRGMETHAYEVKGFWSNVSNPGEVTVLNRLFLQRLASDRGWAVPGVSGLSLDGARWLHGPESGVLVGRDVDIHRKAEITGPVVIGDRCTIGECEIGRFTVIGESCCIGDGTRVLSSVIFDRTTIEDHCCVGFALLGSHVTVRSGSWFLGTSEATAVMGDHHILSMSA